MVAVRAPVAGTDPRALRARLRAEHGLVVTVNAISGALWVRASLAAYTDMDDVARLAASM